METKVPKYGIHKNRERKRKLLPKIRYPDERQQTHRSLTDTLRHHRFLSQSEESSLNVCEHTVKMAPSDCVFTYIYSLPIEKDKNNLNTGNIIRS